MSFTLLKMKMSEEGLDLVGSALEMFSLFSYYD